MTVPLTIDTARLTLRQFTADDWKALHEHYSDRFISTATPRARPGDAYQQTSTPSITMEN